VDFWVGLKLQEKSEENKRKFFLLISLITNLGILGFFKYFNFFISSFHGIVEPFGFSLDFLHINLLLPVGISFYTFQTLSYTLEIYKKNLDPTDKFVDYALFVSFFPQLLAGPIGRANKLLPQIENCHGATKKQFEEGISLIIMGLFKKVMIGDVSGRIVDHIFAEPEFYKSAELVSALLLFSIQIYADFSGYTNIARGTAKLFGFELSKNFEQPYFSTNITDFWRRWHMSLSSWLRDYVFLPIAYAATRKISKIKSAFINSEKAVYIFSTLVTFLLCGLWHGASWNFVFWGVLHGLFLSLHRISLKKSKAQTRFKYQGIQSFVKFIIKISFTYLFILIAWLFFRLADWSSIVLFCSKLINWESSEYTFRFIQITFAFYIAVIVYDFFEYYFKEHAFIILIKNKGLAYGILASMFFVTCVFLFQSQSLPFVYFQF
jgi:D-alanyl-lipoteichoic acid acyltransferase DltB (MBOAT superfamily)